MELRWLIICDKNGRKTEPELQYYDKFCATWLPVEMVEEKDVGEGDFLIAEIEALKGESDV